MSSRHANNNENPMIKMAKKDRAKPKRVTKARLPVEVRREKFMKYLEDSGIIPNLLRVMGDFYQQGDANAPANALEYIRDHLSKGSPIPSQSGNLDNKIEKLQEQEAKLEAQVDALTTIILKFGPPSDPAELQEFELLTRNARMAVNSSNDEVEYPE